MSDISLYEPEDINGCMLMLTREGGRYVLKTDYDLLDKKVDHLINVILSLQEDKLILKYKLENKEQVSNG